MSLRVAVLTDHRHRPSDSSPGACGQRVSAGAVGSANLDGSHGGGGSGFYRYIKARKVPCRIGRVVAQKFASRMAGAISAGGAIPDPPPQTYVVKFRVDGERWRCVGRLL